MATKVQFQKSFDLLERAMELRHFTPKTQKTYLYALTRYIKHTGRDPLKSTLNHILDYQHQIKRENIVSYSTYRINCCALRFFYSAAHPRKWKVEKIPYGKKETRLPVVLSIGEVANIIQHTQDNYARAMIQLMYATGMRIGEALAFKVEHVDKERRRLRIIAGKGRVDRELPISETVFALLRYIYKNRKDPNSDLMFPSGRVHKPLDETFFHKHLKATVHKVGIKKRVTAHVFRHSFATHHLEGGMNIRQLQKLMGHKTVQTTLKYIQVIEERWNDSPCLLKQIRVHMLEQQSVAEKKAESERRSSGRKQGSAKAPDSANKTSSARHPQKLAPKAKGRHPKQQTAVRNKSKGGVK